MPSEGKRTFTDKVLDVPVTIGSVLIALFCITLVFMFGEDVPLEPSNRKNYLDD